MPGVTTDYRRVKKLTVVIDSKEKTPWNFPQWKKRVQSLQKYGCDYSAHGFVGKIGIERKSWADYVGSIGPRWELFKKSLQKLAKHKFRCVIVEGYPTDFISHSSLTTHAVIYRTAIITAHNIPVLFMRDSDLAAEQASLFLVESANRWRSTPSTT